MQGLEWSDLRIFLALHRGRSIREAAKTLNVSHSTVSRRLASMEQELEVTLFIRGTEGLMASAMADLMLERAERIEAEIIGLERDVRGRDAELSGLLRITMPPPFAQGMIMKHLAIFADNYPDIDLQIICSYELADMSRQDADIAIRFQDEPDAHLFGRRLPAFGATVYATPDYIEKHTFTGNNPTARWIGWGDGNYAPDWLVKSKFSACKVRHNMADMSAQQAAAGAGMGMVFLPCIMGDPDPDLVRVPDSGVIRERSGWVLTHPDLKTTERVRVCVRFIVDAIRQHAAELNGQM